MNIGIIGTGRMATSLGQTWSAKGHQLMFGSRDPKNAPGLGQIFSHAKVASISEAAAFGDVVVFVVPGTAVLDAVRASGTLRGKIVLDCTNPMRSSPQGPELATDGMPSGAEAVAAAAEGAQVVKAFNSNFSQLISAGGRVGSQQADTFYCGDDPAAKAAAARLIEDAGFAPVDIGPLRMARFLEAFAIIMIQLMRMPGGSREMGYKVLRP